MSLHWTDTRNATLKQLAADGLTAGQIAVELGGVSRSAVLGKLYRMGVALFGAHGGSKSRPKRVERRAPFRAPPAEKTQMVSIQPKRSNGVRKQVEIIECETLDLPPDQSDFACTIADLTPTRCRWPLSAPAHDMPYCGAEHDGQGPYCVRHHRIAYTGRR